MNGHNDNTAPPRTGMRRVIPPWEYRNLRAWARLRIGAGFAKVLAGSVLLSLHAYGWGALFLVAGMLAYTFGSWEMSVARSVSARA